MMTPEEKIAYRNRIIEELWRNRTVHGISKRLSYQVYLNNLNVQLDDDVTQEVFMLLCKMPVDKLIELYEENNRHLNNYIGRIAFNKGYARKEDKRPYTSLVANVMHASSMAHHNLTISTTQDIDDMVNEDDESDTLRGVLSDDTLMNSLKFEEEEDPYQELWVKVEALLSEEERAYLQAKLAQRKVKGVRLSKAQKTEYTHFRRKLHSLSLLVMGKELTEEQLGYLNFQLGVKLTRRIKQKVEKKETGRPGKRVEQYDQGKLVNTFTSVKEAAEVVGCSQSLIYLGLSGKKRKVKGYVWKFVEETD